MATLKKYQLNGQAAGEETLDDSFAKASTNSQMVKDYIVALRANARQWSASTKGRSDVNHSTQKPHRQKGLGRARQGSLAATQYRGGGRPFGPRPKFDQHVKINKQEKRLALRQLLAEKIAEGKLCVIDGVESFKEPKTQTMTRFLKAANLAGRRVLFLGEGTYEHVKTDVVEEKVSVYSERFETLIKSLRNIPRVEFSLAKNINGYDVLLANTIVVTPGALSELQEWLG